MTEVSFVLAMPGWDVVYYVKGGSYESSPIVAWAVHAVDGTFMRATPVTTDLAWALDDDRVICTPEGDVTCGEFERWPNLPTWLEDMQRREAENPDALPPGRPPLSQSAVPEGNAPIVLENFRRKFERGDAS